MSVPQSVTAGQLKSRLGAAWSCALDSPGLQVFCADARDGAPGAHVFQLQSGVVLGTVFNHGGICLDDGPLRGAFSDGDSAAIVANDADWLLKNCWGNYVAICRDPARGGDVWIFKDPIGTLPCFVTSRDGVAVVFSAITDCCDELGFRDFAINRRFLDVWLSAGRITQQVDALHGVTQVRRGELVHISLSSPDSMLRRFAWSPYDFRWADRPILKSDDAARGLRNVVRSAVRNLANCHDDVLLTLSGGLDSSIVSAYLFDTRPRVSAVTYFANDGSSDPRPWARIAVEAMCPERTTHTEIQADPTKLISIDGYPSVEPGSILVTAMQRASLAGPLAGCPGTTAIFTGDGGDGLFGSSSADLAVASYLARKRRNIPDRRALEIAAQVARHGRTTTWKVLLRAIRKRKSQPLSASNEAGRRLVTQAVLERVPEGDFHPWLSPNGLAHESARKIGGLLGTPDYYAIAPHPAAQFPEVVMPFYSQPIVELCLRIPADVLFLDGRDRGLARRAVSGHVPTALLDRAWKDRPGDFHQQWLRNNATWVRQTLLDGVLVGAGFLDRKAIESALSFTPQRSPIFPGEILSHVETELWVRQWRL